MRPLKAGIVGLGVGEQHLKTYQSLPGVTVQAICDIDPAKLKDVGDRYGIAERHDDYRKITEHPDIDVVSIASYDNYHAEQVISAFRHGKHVMIEKPVALFPEEAEKILRAQQDSGKFITSNLILRHSPRFQELKKQIEDGIFGDVTAIEGDYVHQILWKITEGWRGKMPFYCVTYGGGIHLIDLMRWLIGQEVTEVCGMGNTVLTRGSSYPYPSTITNLLKFERDTLGKTMTIFGPNRTKFHSLNVYGTKRCFVNGLPDGEWFDGEEEANRHVIKTPYPGIEKGDLLPGFIDSIRANTEPLIGVKDIFRVMAICFACWDSVKAGRTVKVNPLI